ncbi:hypothetical protein PAHAL_2G321000 [Panicum hallii]|uniref:Uncharacterized protein n=1 Tax=Panicum hallii TaxID=206008 RepID=A0A2T8KR57_9POAL|nr:hypothetical protein PAHAL_2G321000 [Panicum hallii]
MRPAASSPAAGGVSPMWPPPAARSLQQLPTPPSLLHFHLPVAAAFELAFCCSTASAPHLLMEVWSRSSGTLLTLCCFDSVLGR